MAKKKVEKGLYTKDSIESLSPLEFTRLRPQVYAGDCTYSTQLLVEIVSNAVDEFTLGHGTKIDVSVNGADVSVRDYGQGFLVNEIREDGKSVLEAAFSVLNTSGKYREDGTYEGTSLGSFGIGSKITVYLSHWLRVKTMRDNMWEEIYFKEGVFDHRSLGEGGVSGTLVEWNASEEFFTHPEVEMSKIKDLFKTIVCLCPGLTINLNDNGKQITYYSSNGLNDLVDDMVKDKELIDNRCAVKFANGKNKLDFILTYTSDYGSKIVPYVNTGLTEKGPHITGIKTLITRKFNDFFRTKKWLKEKEDNLTGDDIQEGMYIVFNITAPSIGYDAQVKSTITKIDMSPFTDQIGTELEIWMTNHEKDVKTIADKALAARRAREAAQKAREAARSANEKKTVLKLPSKLTDCWSKDRKKCEIFITEGDSASGNMKVARDNEFQAVLAVRGKILNCYKASIDKMMANAEIRDMIKAFGLELDVKTGKVKFDENKLRYGRIFISADADVDGAHIQSLFYTFIWSFCPELIENGYVYATIPPLYRITYGKDNYLYLQDDAALEQYRNDNVGKNYTVSRMKGLGEMDADELYETLLKSDNRYVKQIQIQEVKFAEKLFDDLMGSAVDPRRKYIEDHAEEANVEI